MTSLSLSHSICLDMTNDNTQRNSLLASIRETFEAGLAIVEKKNHDYGATTDAFANFRSVELLGLSVEKGIMVRLLDKLKRIDNLLTHEAYVTEEAMEDTIVDAINYLAILKAYREMSKPAA